MEDKMIDSSQYEYIQSNKDMAGDNSEQYIHSSVVNDISAH